MLASYNKTDVVYVIVGSSTMATMTASTVEEPDYGRRLMTKSLDDTAHKTPQKLYATITISDQPPYQFRDVTFAEMTRYVDFLACWLEERAGRSNSFETLAFVVIADLRGAMFFHAAVKLGYKASLDARGGSQCAC